MSKLKTIYNVATARTLPVILLADTSGSMSIQGKIEALNMAVAEMLRSFAQEDQGRVEIKVALITFGGTAELHTDLTAASSLQFQPLQADGGTPMGAAFALAQQMLEDQAKIPSRSYTPVLILVSDGQPNDSGWEGCLQSLSQSERAKKAQRFALGIGEDADAQMLQRFLANPNAKVYGANDAHQIKNFFRFVTMSVLSRSRSASPNEYFEILAEELGVDLDTLL